MSDGPVYSAAEKERATRIGRRVDEQRCGLDPFTIVMVICAVINVAINCWRAAHQVKAEDAQIELARRCSNPKDRKMYEWKLAQLIAEKQPNLQIFQCHMIANAIIDDALDESNSGEMLMLMRGAE